MTGLMTAQRQPPDQYPPEPAPETLGLLEIVEPIGVPELRRALDVVERQNLAARARLLSLYLKPARPHEIRDALVRCFMSFGGKALTIEEAEMIATQYIVVLEGLPIWSIERACMRFARGEVQPAEVGAKSIETGLRPGTAHLRIVAHALVERFDAEYRRLTRTLKAPAPRVPETPEEREAALERMKVWRETAGIVRKESDAPIPGHRLRVQEELRKRARARILQEYAANGLAVPEDSDQSPAVSLPMRLAMGWTIRRMPDGSNALLKPDRPPPLNRLGVGG